MGSGFDRHDTPGCVMPPVREPGQITVALRTLAADFRTRAAAHTDPAKAHAWEIAAWKLEAVAIALEEDHMFTTGAKP